MKRLLTAAALCALSLTVVTTSADASPRHNSHHRAPPSWHDHSDWRRGGYVSHDDWNRGERISDYRRYHLKRPPSGYEWRRVDNNFVMVAVATGLIASIIASHN